MLEGKQFWIVRQHLQPLTLEFTRVFVSRRLLAVSVAVWSFAGCHDVSCRERWSSSWDDVSCWLKNVSLVDSNVKILFC